MSLHPIFGVAPFVIGQLTLAVEQVTTFGTSKNFSIPSWVKRITINIVAVSTNGTDPLRIQIGDSGGLETSGYAGTNFSLIAASTHASSLVTNSFPLNEATVAAGTYTGTMVLTLENSSNNTWIATCLVSRTESAASIFWYAGQKALTGTLTQIELNTNTPDTFDLGVINILYE